MGEEAKKEWSLKGMTALVTGGTKGIGHAIVEELAQFGASVHMCGRNKTEIDRCLHEWKESGFNVTGSVCDVSVRVAREKLMEEVSSLFQGKLNIFVSNAGIHIGERTLEATAEDFSYVMATNFESAYHLSQLAHPLLKASGQGSIVFISSVGGLVATAAGIIYSATKGFSCGKHMLNFLSSFLIPHKVAAHYIWSYRPTSLNRGCIRLEGPIG